MVVANNEINADTFCISDQLSRFDTAVQRDDKTKAILFCKIDRCFAYTITFAVAMRYIKTDQRMEFAEEFIHGGNSRRAIHIIIAEYQYLFLCMDRRDDPFNGFIHVFHQPWAMKIVQLWSEK